MENRAEIRMAAAANYYARCWGQPVPDMTPRFAENVIARWRINAENGKIAIPTEQSRNHRQPAFEGTNHFDFGGSSIEVGTNEAVIGREIYRGPSPR